MVNNSPLKWNEIDHKVMNSKPIGCMYDFIKQRYNNKPHDQIM